MRFEDKLRLLQGGGISSAGKKNLIRHLHGERLTQRQAILAKCCDCTGNHSDGRADCRMPHCSLYPFRPYRDDPTVTSGNAILSRRRPSTGDCGHINHASRGNGHKASHGTP